MLPSRYAGSMTRAFLAGAALIACSPQAGTSDEPGALATGTGAAGGGAGAMTGTGATGSGTSGSAGFVGFRTTDAGKRNSGPDGSCAATHAAAERVVTQKTVEIPVTVTKADPVALYLMQDRSGSMKDTPNGASTDKWTQTTTAVNAFVNAPGSNGLDVALGMFPLDNGTCAGIAYDTPLVGMKRLLDPAQSQAIANALTSNGPGGGGGLGGIFGNPGNSGTPIEGALRGAENFCLQYEATSPTGERCVVVLITDGSPNGCAGDVGTLTGIAADGYSKTGLRTFAIGMDGADFGLMDAIAVAGHSDCTPNTPGQEACNVTAGATAFSDALALIRNTVTTTTTTTEIQTVVQGTALPCDFNIPAPPDGEKFDRDKVNVQFFNGTTSDILQVPSAGECANFADVGWYYDDPTTPTKIQLCPATCNQVKAASSTGDGGVVTLDASAAQNAPRVDILLGCATQTVFH